MRERELEETLYFSLQVAWLLFLLRELINREAEITAFGRSKLQGASRCWTYRLCLQALPGPTCVVWSMDRLLKLHPFTLPVCCLLVVFFIVVCRNFINSYSIKNKFYNWRFNISTMNQRQCSFFLKENLIRHSLDVLQCKQSVSGYIKKQRVNLSLCT